MLRLQLARPAFCPVVCPASDPGRCRLAVLNELPHDGVGLALEQLAGLTAEEKVEDFGG